MADPSPYPGEGDDTEVGYDRGAPPGTPRWVKVFGIVVLILVLLFVIMGIASGGRHGPGRHIPSGDGRGHMPRIRGHETTGRSGRPTSADEAVGTVEGTILDTVIVQPDGIHVAAGETVTFVVTRIGQAGHEFPRRDTAMREEHVDKMARLADGISPNGRNHSTLWPEEIKQPS